MPRIKPTSKKQQELIAPVIAEPSPFAPLAERMRPQSLDDVAGQDALIGPGKPLRIMVERGKLHSMIFWGPPGSGKTTLANIIARSVGAPFFALSAISAGVKDLRDAIETAREANYQAQDRTVLFIDEVHRFSKSQQDALLGAVEHGIITLIGATTENPSFEVISPLLSRTRVFVLENLSRESLEEVLDRAITKDTELAPLGITLAEDARRAIIALSGGDARKMLNALELAVQLSGEVREGPVTVPPPFQGESDEQFTPPPFQGGGQGVVVSVETIEAAYGRKASRYDKAGEEHYNIISAFIKSMRGSDPNAALYWCARMIEAGEDLEFIARRMIIFASEDIGNADPNALLLATACWDAVRAVGYPEATIIFGQCVSYLASASKSNASYKGISNALEEARENPNEPVPLHLRNAPTKLMKSLGYHEGYRYAHSEEGHFARGERYLPDGLQEKVFYSPTEQGREKAILERLKWLWPDKYK